MAEGKEWSGGDGSGVEWRGGKGRAGQGRVPDCLGGLSRVGISSRSTRPWNGQPPSIYYNSFWGNYMIVLDENSTTLDNVSRTTVQLKRDSITNCRTQLGPTKKDDFRNYPLKTLQGTEQVSVSAGKVEILPVDNIYFTTVASEEVRHLFLLLYKVSNSRQTHTRLLDQTHFMVHQVEFYLLNVCHVKVNSDTVCSGFQTRALQ